MTNKTIEQMISEINKSGEAGPDQATVDQQMQNLSVDKALLKMREKMVAIKNQKGTIFERLYSFDITWDLAHNYLNKLRAKDAKLYASKNKEIDAFITEMYAMNKDLENQKFDHIMASQNKQAADIFNNENYNAEQKKLMLENLEKSQQQTGQKKELFNLRNGLNNSQRAQVDRLPSLEQKLEEARHITQAVKDAPRVEAIKTEMQSLKPIGKNKERLAELAKELETLTGSEAWRFQQTADNMALVATQKNHKKWARDTYGLSLRDKFDLTNIWEEAKNNPTARKIAGVAALIIALGIGVTMFSLNKQKNDVEAQLKDMTEQADELEEALEAKDDEISDLLDEYFQQQDLIDSLTNKTKNQEKQIEILQRERDRLRQQIEDLKNSADIDPDVLEELQRQLDAVSNILDSSFEKIKGEATKGQKFLRGKNNMNNPIKIDSTTYKKMTEERN